MRYGLTVKGTADRNGIACCYRGRTAVLKVISTGAYLEWEEGGEKKIATNATNFKLQVDLIEVRKQLVNTKGEMQLFYKNAEAGIEYRLGMRKWI
jgi:hypothetical protein